MQSVSRVAHGAGERQDEIQGGAVAGVEDAQAALGDTDVEDELHIVW